MSLQQRENDLIGKFVNRLALELAGMKSKPEDKSKSMAMSQLQEGQV